MYNSGKKQHCQTTTTTLSNTNPDTLSQDKVKVELDQDVSTLKHSASSSQHQSEDPLPGAMELLLICAKKNGIRPNCRLPSV